MQSSIFAFVTQEKVSVITNVSWKYHQHRKKKGKNSFTRCVFITENVKKQCGKNTAQQKSRDNQTPPLHYFLSRTVVGPNVQRIKPNKWLQICFYSLACSIRQEKMIIQDESIENHVERQWQRQREEIRDGTISEYWLRKKNTFFLNFIKGLSFSLCSSRWRGIVKVGEARIIIICLFCFVCCIVILSTSFLKYAVGKRG